MCVCFGGSRCGVSSMDSPGIPPETSNSYCLPGRAGRTPIALGSRAWPAPRPAGSPFIPPSSRPSPAFCRARVDALWTPEAEQTVHLLLFASTDATRAPSAEGALSMTWLSFLATAICLTLAGQAFGQTSCAATSAGPPVLYLSKAATINVRPTELSSIWPRRQRCGCDEVSAWMEVTMDECVSG
jgi:hypothetical protein